MYTVFLAPSMQDYNIGTGDFGTEKEYCNKVADAIYEKFSQNDKISIIRNTKDYLKECVDESNRILPDLHLSIHTNADNTRTRGCEVFCYQKGGEGERFSNIVYEKLSKLTPSFDRGVKEGKDFYGLGKSMFELEQTVMPASLIELDFHDNADSVRFLLDNVKEIATAIHDSICEYFGVKVFRHWADKDFEYLNEQGVPLREKRYCDWITRAEAISLIAKTIKSVKG